jgi:uncharacterized protein (TIGR03435 family)
MSSTKDTAVGLLRVAMIAIVGALMLTSVEGQSAPKFDVASVKRNASGNQGSSITVRGGRLVATNASVQRLILAAYGLQPFELVGGPPWMDKERFDITGTIDRSAGQPTSRRIPFEMLKALLVDRFRLEFHQESRVVPVYHLIKARTDGRLGPRIVASAGRCLTSAELVEGRREAEQAAVDGNGGALQNCHMNIGSARITAVGMTMEDLAGGLTSLTGRLSINATGLTQNYDFSLQWTPVRLPDASRTVAQGPLEDTGPSLFTALVEQLGLELKPSEARVQITVVDRLEPPGAD